MTGWILSLLLTLMLSLGSLVPGAVDRTLTDALSARLGPGGYASVHLEADPFLQLPFGHIPVLEARLEDYALLGPKLSAVNLRVTDLHLDPGALMQRRAVLTAPAHALLQADLEPGDLGHYLTRLETDGRFKGFKLPLVSGTVALTRPAVRFEAGRLVLTAVAEISPTGARMPVSASAALAVENGSRVLLEDLRLSLNGQAVPRFLVAPLARQLNPVADLARMTLPPGSWEIASLTVAPTGMRLRVAGTLTALPGGR